MGKKDETYLTYKSRIKNLCKDSVIDLADKVGLSEYDTELLLCVNKNMSKVATAMKLGICESKFTTDLKRIFNRIEDYEKRNLSD